MCTAIPGARRDRPRYLNEMCALSSARPAGVGAAASESARIANVAESWSALNVPLSEPTFAPRCVDPPAVRAGRVNVITVPIAS